MRNQHDCFDDKVVSWSIGTRPDAKLVNGMLDYALDTLRENERPVIYSDRGGHYGWPGWLDRINPSILKGPCRVKVARRLTRRVKALRAGQK